MTDCQEELLQQAISALKLRDIMLHASRFNRPTSTPQDQEEIEVKQQGKRRVKVVVGDIEEGATSRRILQVYVELGLRINGVMPEPVATYFEIEADFLVEYELLSDVSPEALKEFANYNSVHNVWPFWRQHVFDVVSRGRIPHLDVPLFGGIGRRVAATEEG